MGGRFRSLFVFELGLSVSNFGFPGRRITGCSIPLSPKVGYHTAFKIIELCIAVLIPHLTVLSQLQRVCPISIPQ